MAKFFLPLLCILLSYTSFAGVIKGSVVEDKNGAPLVGVIVSYKSVDTVNGTNGGGVTDLDGKFEITGVKNGDYVVSVSYITFTTEKRNVKIEGSDVVLDIRMKAEVQEMKSVEVKAKRTTNTEAAVINEIKTSNAVVSGTSASQISKTLDRSAADVVKRIPGVAIQDDRFIVVRGLPDRYNTVWLNDAGAPSSESDKKSFSFDIIPSGLIDRILIFKTPSPELPGDFAGGMVKVYTTSLPEKNQLTVSLSSSSRQNTTGEQFSSNKASSTDWLGYDDGSRNIPKGIPARLDKNDANINALSKSFGNDWVINSKTASPDLRFSMALSNVFKRKTFSIGNTFGLSYANTKTSFNISRQDWDTTNSKSYNYIDRQFTNNVSVGIVENVGFSMGNTKIEFKNLYSQVGKSFVTIRNSVRDTEYAANADEQSYAMGYDSKATYAGQLSGTHKNKADTRKYTWTIGYTDVFRNTPDLRRIKYTKSGADTVYKAPIANQVDPINGGGRLYQSLYEKGYSFSHQITQKIKIKDYSFDLNAGNYLEYKSRAFNMRQLGYTITTIGNGANANRLTHLDINTIFADSNVGVSKKFLMDETTNIFDKYKAKNELIASFISAKLPFGEHITVVGGVRYEHNVQSIDGYINQNEVSPKITTDFILPSINASYNFSEKSLVRAAYGKTLNRPEFREFAPIFFYDFDELAGNKGSLFPTIISPDGSQLKVAEVNNIDLRYELYPSSGEMIQIGGFYKTIKNSIQRVLIPGQTGDNKAFTFLNADNAYTAGLELDLRKNLVFLDNKLGTKFLKDFSVVGNLALSKSQLTFDTSKAKSQIQHSTLQGQSPYIVNLGMFYQNTTSGFQGSLLYNVSGARLYAVGTTEKAGESIGELPFQSLDFTVSKIFRNHYMVNFGVQNLLDSKVHFVKDSDRDGKFNSNTIDRDYKMYKPGRYFTIGLKVKF